MDVDLLQLILSGHNALDEGVVIGDRERILHVNDAVCRLYGRTREELLEAGSLIQFLDEESLAEVTALVQGRLKAAEPVPKRIEAVIARPDGTTVDVEIAVTALVGDRQVRTLSLIRDISERRAHEQELQRLAWHDSLTGLPNRRLLLERLERLAARAEREPVHAAVIYLDLDHFKAVNDEYGHEAGDLVLMAVADRLRHSLRIGDSAARLGGDEFVVLCEQVADDRAVARVTRRVVRNVERPVEIPGGFSLPVRCSVGAHRVGPAPVDPNALIRDADRAMYAARAVARGEA